MGSFGGKSILSFMEYVLYNIIYVNTKNVLYIEALQREIFRMGTHTILFDYTFNFGDHTYAKYDTDTLRAQNPENEHKTKIERELHECKINPDIINKAQQTMNKVVRKSKDNKAKYQKEKLKIEEGFETQPHTRDKVSKILISWLLCVNFREFVMTINPTPGIGEDHDHLLPILLTVIVRLLKESEYEDVFKLLKCDGYDKNSLVNDKLREVLLQFETIYSNNGQYVYHMKEWTKKLYVKSLCILYKICFVNY